MLPNLSTKEVCFSSPKGEFCLLPQIMPQILALYFRIKASNFTWFHFSLFHRVICLRLHTYFHRNEPQNPRKLCLTLCLLLDLPSLLDFCGSALVQCVGRDYLQNASLVEPLIHFVFQMVLNSNLLFLLGM